MEGDAVDDARCVYVCVWQTKRVKCTPPPTTTFGRRPATSTRVRTDRTTDDYAINHPCINDELLWFIIVGRVNFHYGHYYTVRTCTRVVQFDLIRLD